MDTLKLETINYKGKKYNVAIIPNIFPCNNDTVIIGSESLNRVILDDDFDYSSEDARRIDEQIYAYVDESFFKLSESAFITKIRTILD